MRDYFITGGLGFIGYHLTQELIKENDTGEVTLYDAQKHYIPLGESNWPFYQQYRLNDLPESVNIARGDTNDRGLLKEKLERFKPDVIYHLAALPIANISNTYPEEARLNILEGTITLLDILREATFDFERVIYTSSSMVYGDFKRDENGEIIPASEDQLCRPLGLYGAMKLSGENMTRSYGKRFNLPYTIVRPSAVYGPTDCNRRVTEIFVLNALKGEPLRLDNGGYHKLDFTYVKDLAKGFIKVAKHENAQNDTFNLTRGKGCQIRELAEVIGQYIPGIETYEEEVDVSRPNRGALDISKARNKLDYDPDHSLEEGIKKYIDFLEEVPPDS